MHIAECSRIHALAARALLLIPVMGIGENALADPGKTSAAQEFRIVIPGVLLVLENRHPVSLIATADGDWSAQQQLVVASNMRRGFCVTLRVSDPEVQAWRLHTPQARGITLDTVQDGYRVCTSRPGHYTLLLHHEFDATAKRPTTGALRWPVKTDITAL